VVKGFCQWLSPDYATDLNRERWTQEVVELASLGAGDSHATLLFYYYGDQSTYITESLLALPTKEKKDQFIFDFFRPYFSRLPHFDPDSADCQPTGCLATDWLHDELAGFGSYTNFQVGLEEGDKDVRIMREGIPDQGLWLAGEHTAPIVALCTTTGAYWSGEAVAKRIMERYGCAVVES